MSSKNNQQLLDSFIIFEGLPDDPSTRLRDELNTQKKLSVKNSKKMQKKKNSARKTPAQNSTRQKNTSTSPNKSSSHWKKKKIAEKDNQTSELKKKPHST